MQINKYNQNIEAIANIATKTAKNQVPIGLQG